jgi:hypothetical protein
LRYRPLIVPSILNVLLMFAVGSGTSAKARRTTLVDEMHHASNARGGASVTTVTGEGAGFYHRAMLERKEGQSA